MTLAEVAEVVPWDEGSLAGSWIGLGLLVTLLVGVLVILLATAMRASVALGRIAKGVRGELPPQNEDAVLAGTAELVPEDQDRTPPVRVEVRQARGGVGSQGRRRFANWSGAMGPSVARPFDLRLGSGEVVRVDPENKARFIDSLDDTIDVSKTERIRRALLEPGELVQVTGRLESTGGVGGAYRGGGARLVFRPPSSGEMWITSSDELRGALGKRRKIALVTCIPIVLFLGFVGPVLGGTFVRLALRGHIVEAPVRAIEIDTYKKRNAGVQTNYYILANDPGTRAELREHIADEDFNRLAKAISGDGKTASVAEGLRVPFLVDPEAPNHYVMGRHAYIAVMDLVLGAIAVSFGLSIFAFARHRSKPWFEKKHLDEREYLD